MKDLNRLPLFKDGESVGAIERTPEGCRIIFDAGLPAKMTGDHSWKSLTLRIPWSNRPIPFNGINLPPYFVGLLPEGLRMRALVRQLKTSEDDYFSLLAGSGSDPIGSVHFAPDKFSDLKKPSSSEPIDFSKLDLKELRRTLLNGDVRSEPIAGVQEKISGSRVNHHSQGHEGSVILKLASPDFPDLVENEAACLQLASRCGVAVNDANIVVDRNGESALAVTRFDREWDSATSRWTRFHVEDACQFLDLYPADKYRVSIQTIANQLALISYTPALEILSLLRLYAFCYLIGNGDLHAKNISVIQKSPTAGIVLSPAYDLVCTSIYGDFKMALKLDGKDSNFKRHDFVAFSKRYGISKPIVDSMLDDLLEAFGEHVGLMYSVPLVRDRKSKMLEAMWTQRTTALSV